MTEMTDFVGLELKYARRTWPNMHSAQMKILRSLIQKHRLSVSLGEIIELDDKWYVTHSGLLQVASRRRCCGIKTKLEQQLSDPLVGRWIFKATVYKTLRSRGFVGYGDADPSNCSTLVHGAEMRVAETRAVNRALRKAYGIGLCSVEELGSFSSSPRPAPVATSSDKPRAQNSSNNGQPRLRDQLCLLVRKYNLNPALVKAYAADFCGTEALSGASRDLVESFISHLSAAVVENRDALVCKLNSYTAQEPQS
jgi:hypothetical protein